MTTPQAAEKQPQLRLDDQHRYWLATRRIPGATECLRLTGIINTDWYTEESRVRGNFVHKCCKLLAADNLDESSVLPQYKGFIDGYKLFIKESLFRPDPLRCEIPMMHPAYHYGVTPDQPGTMNGPDVMLEIKTLSDGSVPSWTGLQLAAQAMAMWPDDFYTKPRLALALYPDGSYKLKRFEDDLDFEYFLAALSATIWKQQNGGLPE